MKNPCILRMALHAALVVTVTVGFARTGSAHRDGVFEASGQIGGFYCINCHGGGANPTVAFDGPTAMDLGSMATFRFTITSQSPNQIAAGFDVAVSGGTLGEVPGQGTILDLNELTHSSPKMNEASGQAVFEFTWQAPASAGAYTLFGAGTSVNLDSLRTGDGAARTTYDVFVGIDTPTPTATSAFPTPTATATVPAGSCVGDCGLDGEVTVNEIITGVSMALGVSSLSACPEFDASGEGQVTVDEILRAVSNALTGCARQ